MALVSDTAMVMAAGMGKRMRPLTASQPKPLVRVSGKPLIDHTLDRLHEAGVAKAVVNVHYLADALEAHLGDREAPQIIISDERSETISGSMGRDPHSMICPSIGMLTRWMHSCCWFRMLRQKISRARVTSTWMARGVCAGV